MEGGKRPEILAPAGSREAFFAAISSGADAVYLAGNRFGARAYAANFSLEELGELIKYAHLRRVAVYVAVNTLLGDDELAEAVEFCRAAYEIGADALIVQDLGLVAELKRLYPEICLNASTQMTLHNTAGVGFAEQFGFARVILAREVSLADIGAICAATPMEVEVFAHGALCICFSGQCLFSSMVGGRSGNRGRCAQPCRLKYHLQDKDGRDCGFAHLLSPKDLNTIELLPELSEAGVVSLKIEGRMKRPEYVAAVTAAYAAAARGKAYDRQALSQAFNRGFTTAYLKGEPCGDMMSYERPNNRGTKLGRIVQITNDELVIKLDAPLLVGDGLEIWVTRGGRQGFTVPISAKINGDEARIMLSDLSLDSKNCRVGDRIFKTFDSTMALDKTATTAQDELALRFEFSAHLGEKPCLAAYYGEYKAEAFADYEVPMAKNRPADRELLEKQLGRLGGSGWQLAELMVDMDDGIMLPASVLNNLRRDVVAALEEKLLAPWADRNIPPRVVPQKPGKIKLHKSNGKAKLAVTVDSLAAARAACVAGADLIYWQGLRARWQQTESMAELVALGVPIYAVLPTIATEAELAVWERRLCEYRRAGFAGILANNPWAYELWRRLGAFGELVADFGMNCFNAAAAQKLAELGATRVGLSRELNNSELAKLAANAQNVATEVQVFGNLELMNSRHCPIGAICGGKTADKSCSGACRQGGFVLRDEKGFEFPVYTDEFCRSHIYNGHQLCLIAEAGALAKQHSVLRLDLLHYDPERVGKITSMFVDAMAGFVSDTARDDLAKLCGVGLTKGHFFRGVE